MIVNFCLFNNDIFIFVNKIIKCEILIDVGINIILDWDFEDGWRFVLLFIGDFLRLFGDFLEYLYIDYGVYFLNVIVLNFVSKVIVIKYFYV